MSEYEEIHLRRLVRREPSGEFANFTESFIDGVHKASFDDNIFTYEGGTLSLARVAPGITSTFGPKKVNEPIQKILTKEN
jgi:hypothetical protein